MDCLAAWRRIRTGGRPHERPARPVYSLILRTSAMKGGRDVGRRYSQKDYGRRPGTTVARPVAAWLLMMAPRDP